MYVHLKSFLKFNGRWNEREMDLETEEIATAKCQRMLILWYSYLRLKTV